MDRGIEKLIELGGVSLAEAVRMATVNPARAGNVEGRTRGLLPGERADLVQFHYDAARNRLTVEATYLDGEKVFG